MITFLRVIGIFFAGIFSGYGADAQCSARRFPNPQSSPLEFGKAVHSDESSGGAPLNYFLPFRFF
jgi:hypothetical protein